MTSSSFASSYTLSLSTSGAQNINVSGAGTGTVISTDTINVQTTCRYGYSFTIATSVNDNNLYLNGDSSNNTAGSYFSAADGTTALTNATNTWGYYFDGTSANAPTVNSVFSPVPTLGSADALKAPLTTPSSTDINDSFNIYYGVKASSSLATGTYEMIPDTNNSNHSGTIVYQTVIADACTKYTVQFNPTDTSSGSSVTGTGTMDDQTVSEGEDATLNANTYVAPDGYSFIGWNTAQDGTGEWYNDEDYIYNLTTAGNTIILYAQWSNCPANKICYDKNATNGVEGTMANQDIAASVMLHASNYSREDYGFAGWSTKPISPELNDNDKALPVLSIPDGIETYGPNETISVAMSPRKRGLTLYAMWVEYSVPDYIDVWATSNRCDDLNSGEITGLKDQRDGNVYAVSKLADGKCWMIENLRLDNQYTTGEINKSLAQGYDASFTGLADAEQPWERDSTIANSLYSINGTTENTISGIYQGFRFPRYNNQNTKSRATDPSTSSNTYGYGNYYTWAAAIADTTHYTDNNTNVGTSICPAGWHLPTGGAGPVPDDSDYWHLGNAIMGFAPANSSSVRPYYTSSELNGDNKNASQAFSSFPNNYVYSGSIENGSIMYRGTIGRYYTSTVYSNPGAYEFSLSDGGVTPGTRNDDDKFFGNSVRCVTSGS